MKKRDEFQPRSRSRDLVCRELNGEMLVYDLKCNRAHCLNLSAAVVWKHCNGRTDVTELSRILKKELDAPASEEMVWLALEQLDKFQLLESDTTAVLDLTGQVSRRDLVRRLGVAAILLPAIISISAPTAQAQGSCRPNGQPCTSFLQCCSSCCTGGTCQAPTAC